MKFDPFDDVMMPHGAPLGRAGADLRRFAGIPAERLCVRHCGGSEGYDRGGAYWGHSDVWAVWPRGRGHEICAYVERRRIDRLPSNIAAALRRGVRT